MSVFLATLPAARSAQISMFNE